MTIHVHRTIASLSSLGHGHIQGVDGPVSFTSGKKATKAATKAAKRAPAAPKAPKGGDEPSRTWALTCTPECEAHLLATLEFTAGHAADVPLTVDEKREAEALAQRSNVEVGKMAKALAELASERVTAQAS